MERENIHASVTSTGNANRQTTGPAVQQKEIIRLKQETHLLELIAYSLLSVVGVFSLFALLGVDFGTAFDKAPLLLLLTCCSALTYMTRKNKLARMEAELSDARTGPHGER